MYWVFIAGAECINARFMYWLVYSFIILYCIICILLITICTILILLAVLQCVNKETIIIIIMIISNGTSTLSNAFKASSNNKQTELSPFFK